MNLYTKPINNNTIETFINHKWCFSISKAQILHHDCIIMCTCIYIYICVCVCMYIYVCQVFRVFPEILDPCFTCFALSHSSCNTYQCTGWIDGNGCLLDRLWMSKFQTSLMSLVLPLWSQLSSMGMETAIVQVTVVNGCATMYLVQVANKNQHHLSQIPCCWHHFSCALALPCTAGEHTVVLEVLGHHLHHKVQHW